MRNLALLGILVVLLVAAGCKNKAQDPTASAPAAEPAAQVMEHTAPATPVEEQAQAEEQIPSEAAAAEQTETAEATTQEMMNTDSSAESQPTVKE